MVYKKICFVCGADPSFLGGISLYQKNLIKYLKDKKFDFDITWIYSGNENREYNEKGVRYIEISLPKINFLREFIFNFKVLNFLNKNYFDIINSHAIWGYWMNFYKKKKNQKLIHVYHGVTYNFFKNHLKRFSLMKKIILLPTLIYSYLIEKPPIKKSDEIIYVSEKVGKQMEKIYGKKKDKRRIRTGVNLKDFNPLGENSRKYLKLDKTKCYGLYVGKGGYWTKGLDRVIKLSEEICKLDKDFRLILIGPDYNKTKQLFDKKFIIFLKDIPRNEMPKYYNSADIFFCMSRYEGGAPTLVVSEAMASGCLLVCSQDSQQEILNDGENGLIVKKNYFEEAKRIIKTLNNKKELNGIINNSLKTIKGISFEKWGEEYFEFLEK